MNTASIIGSRAMAATARAVSATAHVSAETPQ
jgi:hypothetical protein